VPDAEPASGDVLDKEGSVTRLLRYAANSPIPLTGSPFQTAYGIKEIRAAKTHNAKVNGWVDAGSGASGVFNDLSTIAVFANPIMKLPSMVMSIANPVYAVSGIVYGAIDGGRDLYNAWCHRDSGHAKTDLIVGLVKIGSSGLGAVGAMSGNLPLVIAANLIYLGAVGYQNKGSIKNVYHSAKDFIKAHPHPIKESPELAKKAVHAVAEKVGHAAHVVADKVAHHAPAAAAG
jgi:hypothetical protein